MVMRPKQPGQKRRKHKFLRHNWFRFPRLGTKWRYPKGHHSKMRQCRKSRPPMPNAGYGSPFESRGLVRGMKPVLVNSLADLNKINSKAGEAAVIARGIGKKKVLLISAEAEKKGIKILNHRKVSAAQRFAYEMKKKKEELKAAASKSKDEKKEGEHNEEKDKTEGKLQNAVHEQKEMSKADRKSEQAKGEKPPAAKHQTDSK